eukprot:365471-Chlamydomonas_euryale.AAC.11
MAGASMPETTGPTVPLAAFCAACIGAAHHDAAAPEDASCAVGCMALLYCAAQALCCRCAGAASGQPFAVAG